MNYASLTTQIRNYANRTDDYFSSQIPFFIDQAISRIYSEARNIGFQEIVTNPAFFTVGSPFAAKPVNWKETISIQYTAAGSTSPTVFLLPRSYEFCQTYWPNRDLTGMPLFYAEYSYTQFYISPTPNVAYPVQLTYLSTPQFNGANPTNFLTDRYPNLLLYASMLETASFLKDDERIPVFEAQYNRALQNINNDTKERYNDRTVRRDKS